MTARKLQTIIVSTKTGTDIKGVLRERALDALVLTSASVAGEVAGRLVWRKLVGDVVIPLDNVDYWQTAIPPQMLAEMQEVDA